MPAKEHFVSRPSAHDQAAVLYVVSRSGKVLGSEDCAPQLYDGDYFEGELEGWIFWGSSKGSKGTCKRSNGSSSCKRQEESCAAPEHGCSKSFVRESFSTFLPTSWNEKMPFLVWDEETSLFPKVFQPPSWKQISPPGRRIAPRKRRVGASEDDSLVFASSLSPLTGPQKFQRPDHHSSLTERNYKVGLSQLAVLQEWDPATRESAARWATWLLKMLRKTGAPPLQHLLFATCSAVLPIMSCSLAREHCTREPDPEVYKCVDVFLGALSKCEGCFSTVQWDILEERLAECQQLRMKVGSFEKDPMRTLSIVGLKDLWPNRGASSSSLRVSKDLYHPRSNWRNEQLSNDLLQREGVAALVKRALREKLYTPGSRFANGTNVSLVCPISRKRVKVPARGRDCNHSQSFDLQTFLEGNLRPEPLKSWDMYERKKAKTVAGTWKCPICSADATWPLLVVDRDLLRILEVLPEQMPLVCLQPNGRWHVVWTTDGPETTDTQLTKISVLPSFKPGRTSEVFGIGQVGEPWHDRCRREEEVWSLQEVQILHRAYTSWKEAHQSDRMEFGWGPSSNIADWTGGLSSSSWPASPQLSLSYGEARSKLNCQITEINGDDPAASLNIPSIEEASQNQEPRVEPVQDAIQAEEENRSASDSHVGDALQTGNGPSCVRPVGAGTVTRIPAGQFKSRPKLKARKS